MQVFVFIFAYKNLFFLGKTQSTSYVLWYYNIFFIKYFFLQKKVMILVIG